MTELSRGEKALIALRRAQKIAYIKAARYNLMVPIWRDNQVVDLDPKVELEKPYFKAIKLEPGEDL